MQLPQLTEMDTDVANLRETFAETSPDLEDGSYCEDLDSRLYDLAERLVSMVDGEDDDDDDSESDIDDVCSVNAGNAASPKSPQENLDAERCLLSASYTQCMEEALRFLVQEEGFAQNDVMVIGLQRHLEGQKSNAVDRAMVRTQESRCRTIRGPALY